jgi:hypothetical protein
VPTGQNPAGEPLGITPRDPLRPTFRQYDGGCWPPPPCRGPDSDASVTEQRSDARAPNQTAQPRPLPPTPREGQRLPRSKAPSTNEEPSSGPLQPRPLPVGVAHDVTSLSVVSHVRARPPSPTPAATGMASLSQTPLVDFCKQNETRARQTGPSTSPGAAFTATDAARGYPRSAASSVSPVPKHRKTQNSASHAGRDTWSQLARSGNRG